MRLATIDQSREIEKITEKEYLLSAEVLMETAGSGAAREINQAYYPELTKGGVAVVCGPGNNGGDALVVARHLHSMGHRDLDVYFLAPAKKRSKLFKHQLKRAELMGLRLIDLEANPKKMAGLESASLIIDGVFGIGLKSKVQEPFETLIDSINRARTPVVSLDVPSGLDADRGLVLGSSVRAEMTVTFGLGKPGFFVHEGPLHVGRLRVLSIGFPFELLRRVAVTHFGFHERLARRYLPERKDTSNKSDHGHLLVVAGSKNSWGAGVLCANAAFRVGVGYVTFASFENPSTIVSEIPEVYTASLLDAKVLENPKLTAIALGPGLGVNSETKNLIVKIKKEKREKVVLDADAITVCAQEKLFPLPESWVLTPHAGELARMLNIDSREINNDRYHYALEASRIAGCHVLLKGYRSILAFGERTMVIQSGNAALAKAGTGDVLTGMIGGFLAQDLPTVQATATAAYLHGRMSDEWVRSGSDKRSLLASDIGAHLPQLMNRIASGTF
ncbi:MAG: NAD(P)H-hydrate dehydratase [Pseudomonadota bacterium]|nr:NAD(P)H-hydrate dehydratase [Pseudomonadota bacterium]